MFNSKYRIPHSWKYFKIFFKKIIKAVYLINVAFIIGFSNACLDESRMINDIKNKVEQEQVMEDEDTNVKKDYFMNRHKIVL